MDVINCLLIIYRPPLALDGCIFVMVVMAVQYVCWVRSVFNIFPHQWIVLKISYLKLRVHHAFGMIRRYSVPVQLENNIEYTAEATKH